MDKKEKLILVIDDEVEIRNIIKEILSDEGYNTLTVPIALLYARITANRPAPARPLHGSVTKFCAKSRKFGSRKNLLGGGVGCRCLHLIGTRSTAG